jgi:uncharacterized membrane protein YhaH (DUF805 family)
MENNQIKRPDNYLAFAIVMTILFFPPTGIVAIVKAAQVDSLYNQGRYEEAEAMSLAARKFSRISLWVGIGIIALYALLYFLYTIVLLASF